MPIRMTGMISNLDTDSIVKELMKAQSQKKVKIENKITLNEWTTEKWSALNDKIKSFYTGILSKVKMQGEYQTKKATSSNEAKLTVSAAIGATNGSYTIEIERLATSQSMTSAKIPDRKVQETVTNPDGSTTTTEVEKPVTTSTKLSELSSDWGNNSVINIQNGDKTVEFEVTENTTISDFINTCKSAGLTASFDADQKRIFLSSSESGEDSKFSITTSSINNTDILNKKKDLREEFGYESASSTTRVEIDSLINTYVSEEWASDAEDTALNKLENLLIQTTTTEYINELKDKWENDPSSLDGDARTMMDNEASIAETKYRQECLDNNKDIDEEKLEKLRKEIVTPLIEFKEKVSNRKNATEITKEIYNFIVNNKINEMLDIKLRNYNNIELSDEYNTSYKLLINVLEDIVLIFKDEKMTFDKYKELLQVGLNSCELGKIPATQDQVILGDTERTRSNKLKIVFVIGINDGAFPKVNKMEGYLNDTDREVLLESGIELAKNSTDCLYEEQFNIYRTLTTPEEKLFLSYSSSDKAGASIRPSILIKKISRIFPNITIESDIIEKKYLISNSKATFEDALRAYKEFLEGNSIEEEWKDILRYFYIQEQFLAFTIQINHKRFLKKM